MTRREDDFYLPDFPEDCICGAPLDGERFECSPACEGRARREEELLNLGEGLYCAMVAHEEGHVFFTEESWEALVHGWADLWLDSQSDSERQSVAYYVHGVWQTFAELFYGYSTSTVA